MIEASIENVVGQKVWSNGQRITDKRKTFFECGVKIADVAVFI